MFWGLLSIILQFSMDIVVCGEVDGVFSVVKSPVPKTCQKRAALLQCLTCSLICVMRVSPEVYQEVLADGWCANQWRGSVDPIWV